MYEVAYEEVKKINNTKVNFFVIDIKDLKAALKNTYEKLSDSSWINQFEDEALKLAYRTRLERTINVLEEEFKKDSALTKSTGEYLVSITSKEIIVDKMSYTDIPLGEIVGSKSTGNGGFDYFSENKDEHYIIFGEAKYKTNKSAYSSALNQIIDFINENKDMSDYITIRDFIDKESGDNLVSGVKGYSAGFTFIGKNESLLENIFNDDKYKSLLNYEEIILIGVTINEK